VFKRRVLRRIFGPNRESYIIGSFIIAAFTVLLVKALKSVKWGWRATSLRTEWMRNA
jgi:hypothetical protein